jgi:peroxiredoxin
MSRFAGSGSFGARMGLVALGVALAGCAVRPAVGHIAPPAAAAAGADAALAAPAFQVRDVQGQTVSVPAGQPVVLLFGAASGCASCAFSEQQMAQVYPQYAHQAEFVTVDVTPGDSKSDVLGFAQQLGASWPHVLAQGTDLVSLYHVAALDTMYVLNARGQVVAESDAGLSAQQLQADLQQALRSRGAARGVSA